MPIYKVQAPNGKIYKVEAPEGAKDEDLFGFVRQQVLVDSMIPPKAKEKAGFLGSFKEAVTSLGLADEAAVYAANPTEENRDAFLSAAESKYKSVGGFGKGKNWEAFKEMLGSSLGSLIAPIGAAFAGAAAGPVGAAAAFGGASAAQYEIANLQRQAEEQRTAQEAGMPVPEFDLGKATLSAFGQAALDVIPGAYVAKSLRAFPIAQRLLGSEKTAQEAADILIDAYKKGNITRKGEILKGVGLSVAFEVPQEVAQQALERWQAGLSLTDDEAREEFKQAAIGAAVLSPLFGGPAGLGQYKAKVQEIGQQYARDAEMLFGGQAPEQTGFSPEMYDNAAAADRRDAEEAIFGESFELGGFPASMYQQEAAPETEEDVDAQIEARRQARLDRIAEGDREAQQLGLVEEPYQPFKQERTPEYERDVRLGFTTRLRRLRQARPDLDDNTIDYLMAEGYSDKQIAEYEPAQREEGLADVYSDEEIAGTGLPSTQPEPVRPTVTAAEETVTAPKKAEAKPDRISQRIIKSGYGSDFARGLYDPDPIDTTMTNFSDLGTVTSKQIERARNYIKNISQNLLRQQFGDEVTLYRGLKGTEDKTPVLSYSLNNRTAEYFANKQGIRSGKVEEIKVPVSQVLSYSEAIGKGPLAEEEVLIANPRVQSTEDPKQGYAPKPPPRLHVDNPGGEWLQYEKEYAASRGVREDSGAPKLFGALTATYKEAPIYLPVEMLKRFRGINDEQNNVRKKSLDYLVEEMGRTGKLPPRDNFASVPFINVDQNGVPYVNEGNHRIMAAAKLGWEWLPVNVAYYSGGEQANGPLRPDRIKDIFEQYSKTTQPKAAPRIAAEEAKAAAPTVDRMALIRQAQEKRVAANKAREFENLWSRAAEAFDAGKIDEDTYQKITEELKKPAPNLIFINKALLPQPTIRRAAPVKVVDFLREDATDAEIAAYIRRAKERDKAAGIKETPKVRKAKIQTEQIEEELQQPEKVKPTAVEPIATEKPEEKVTHPEWATNHEKDVGGEIVYSDADTALLRGHSMLTGQNVYAAIDRKTGNRTRVDIEKFTGALFTPEQKQRLIQAKNKIIARDAEQLAQNPDGPFTGAKSNVVASENVNPNYANFLSSLMRSMGLGDIKVFLLHPEDIRNQQDKYKLYGDYASAMSAGLDSGEDGSLRAYGPNRKNFYISFRSGMSEGRSIETIAHELGHLIQRVSYDNAAPETKAAIRAEFETWLKENEGKDAVQLINALRNRETAAAHSETVTANTKLRDSYWRSFSEWFADNTSKWATTSEKPVGIVEKFFAELAKKLRALIAKVTGNKFVPAKSVKEFLDSMGPGSARSWLGAEGVVEKNPFDDQARASMSPGEQRANDSQYIEEIANSQNTLPEPTPEIKEGARTAMSMVPSWLRRGVLSFESPHQMADMYRPYTNQLDEIWDLQNRDGAALRARTDKIHDDLKRATKVMSKYAPAQRDRFYDVMLKTSVESVEVLDMATDSVLKDSPVLKAMNLQWKPNTASPLYAQFMAMPKEVRDIYRDLRLAYIGYAHDMEKVMESYLTPSEWQKLQMEFNKKRLPVYLPLFRSGDYKLIYKDKDGETNVRQFETDAERQAARRELVRSGIPNGSIVDRMQNEFSANDIPPAGFYGKVVGALREKGVSEDAIKQIFDLYMDYLPSNSVLQLRRKRQNTAGYELDVLRGYASVGSAYARRLTKMEFMPKLATAYENLQADLGQGSFWVSYKDKNGKTIRNGYDTAELRQAAINTALKDGADRESVKFYGLKDEEARDVVAIAGKQLDFFNNPQMDNISSKAAYFSYTMYMGGNISSAVIDLTHIPMVVYSLLGGKHGFGRAAASMLRAHSQYVNNKFPAEISEMPSLLKRANDEGVLGEQRLADLAEFRNKLGPVGSAALETKARVDHLLGYLFRVSDKYNRGLTFISAYDLAKKDLQKKGVTGDALTNQAYNEAKRAVFDSYGSSFPRTGPAIAGNGLAKLALTFKRFAINRIWLLSRAFINAAKGESKEVRNMARKELIGYFGMAYLFSGVQGMPLVGAGQLAASLLNGAFGDDDEPYDPQQETLNSVGAFNFRGPINYAFNVDVASRSGWDQMLWRDDPRRIAEVGPATYAMEQLLGPAFGYAVNIPRAMEHFSEGRFSKGMETLTPRVVSNIMKAYRFGTEGALTSDNVPIVKDISKYNQFMQILGFAPSDVSEAYQVAGVASRTQKEILERRTAILRRMMMAVVTQDDKGKQEAIEEIQKFNAKHPGKAISSDSVRRSVTQHYVKLNQSVAGIRVDPKLAREVYEQLGYEAGEEEED